MHVVVPFAEVICNRMTAYDHKIALPHDLRDAGSEDIPSEICRVINVKNQDSALPFVDLREEPDNWITCSMNHQDLDFGERAQATDRGP